MTYSCGMFFSSLRVNICTFPQKPNLTHVMQEQKCLFSGSLKQTDVSSICQQVMRKLLLLQDIITYALLRRMLVSCGKDNSILQGIFPVVWKILTGSQNHGVLRHLWRQSSPILLFKQGQLQQVTLEHVQWRFDYLQGWRLHMLSGQPAPVFDHPYIKKKHHLHLNIISCISTCAVLRRVRLCLLSSPPSDIDTNWQDTP